MRTFVRLKTLEAREAHENCIFIGEVRAKFNRGPIV